MIIIGGIGGGVGTAISGGNFWQGAGYGLIAAGLNHALHNTYSNSSRSLLFDGKYLIILKNGNIVAKFPAVSGKPLADGTFDYSSERQKINDVGPIPEGDYLVNMNRTQKWSDLGIIQKSAAIFDLGRFPGGTIAWGAERVDILSTLENPFDVRLRYGFTIHGGSNPGSAGCIDLTTFDKAFFNLVRNTGTWNLRVKY